MQRKKVMVIDDDKVFLDELHEMLDLSGYETIKVSNPFSLVEKACFERPDVIVMDIKMPGKDGLQLAESLKKTPQTSSIPIIAISAYFDIKKHPIQKSVHGINTMLAKPFNPIDIIFKIEDLLSEP